MGLYPSCVHPGIYVRPIGGYLGFYLRPPVYPQMLDLESVLRRMRGKFTACQIQGVTVAFDLHASVQNCTGASEVVRDLIAEILAADEGNKIPRPASLWHDRVLNHEILAELVGAEVNVASMEDRYKAIPA